MSGLYFKGVGVGTYLHSKDLFRHGIAPKEHRARRGADIVEHVVRFGGTPLVSLTRSFGVACDYAKNYSLYPPTATNPGVVYEVVIPDPAPVPIIDPVQALASTSQGLASLATYHHDGDQRVIEYLLDPIKKAMGPYPISPQRPPAVGAVPATIPLELNAMVYALRDAEILVEGKIDKSWIKAIHLIF